MSLITEPIIERAPETVTTGRGAEQSRAIYPDVEGSVTRDGQRLVRSLKSTRPRGPCITFPLSSYPCG